MKAVRGEAGGVRVVDIAEPDGDGELVKVVAVSICGSDLNYLRRGSTQIQGHEIAGVLADGTRVVVESIFGCQACEWCERGAINLCRNAGANILGLTVSGGMSEYFRAPRTSLIVVPDELRLEDASIAEPGAVAWHACRKGGVGPGSRVAVVGAGAIGILAALAAQTMGAVEVALEARHPHQIALGKSFGAGRPTGDYDVVIEASGSEAGIARAIELARPTGTVSTVSVYKPDVTWPFMAALLKEVQIVPSIGFSHDSDGGEIGQVARMLAARPEIAAGLITHRFGIEDAGPAFEAAAAHGQGAIRVVVHP